MERHADLQHQVLSLRRGLAANECNGKECPVGRSSKEPSASCDACETGTVAPAGYEQCFKCFDGQYSANTNAGGKECPVGRSSNEPSASCDACVTGTMAPAGYKQCSECFGGQYSANTNASGKECPVGSSSNEPSAS